MAHRGCPVGSAAVRCQALHGRRVKTLLWDTHWCAMPGPANGQAPTGSGSSSRCLEPTGTFELAVPCCQHADFPITVVVNGDGSATGTVTDRATIDGGMKANLPVGSDIDMHFKPSREGEVLIVHSDINPPGVNVTICRAGQSDSDCSLDSIHVSGNLGAMSGT